LLCAPKEISGHCIIETIDSLNCKWDCGNAHNHIDDCAGMEEEDQDCQGSYADLNIYG
jgi:hypothetical protein